MTTTTSASTDAGTSAGSGTSAGPTSTPTTTTMMATSVGPTTDTGGGGCGSPCPMTTPLCGSEGVCVPCTADGDPDGSCFALDPQRPRCDTATGACVECLGPGDCPMTKPCLMTGHVCGECASDADCGAKRPNCGADHMCFACREHAECPATACELDAGKCFPAADTVIRYAEPGAESCAQVGCESPEAPCCLTAIAFAQAVTTSPESTHVVVHVKSDPNSVPDAAAVVLSGVMFDKKVFALLGTKELPELSDMTQLEPAVVSLNAVGEITPMTSKLFVAGVRIAGGQNPAAFACTKSTLLWIDDAIVEDMFNGDGTIHATGVRNEGCSVIVRRTLLRRNERGIDLLSGSLQTINSIIGGSKTGEIALGINTSFDALYTSVISTLGTPGGLLSCNGSPMTLLFRNSALLAKPDAANVVQCAPAPNVVTSVVTDAQFANNGNVVLMPAEVELGFTDWTNQDWTLKGDGGKLADVAIWIDGDPPTDFQGDERPKIPQTHDFAGADRP